MDAFAALADGSRRQILELLADGELQAGQIAGAFPMTRPGVSKHLRLLREAGLVTVRTDGTRRLYSLDPAGLDEVDGWINRTRSFWEQRLDALETEVRRGRRSRKEEE